MPAIRNKAKLYAEALRQVLESTQEKDFSNKIDNFKKLLKRSGGMKIAGRVVREFKTIWSEKDGQIAQIITASPLSKGMREQIELVLKNKGFVLKERVDPNVLGGLAIVLGKDRLIDYTIKKKLKTIWNRINVSREAQ